MAFVFFVVQGFYAFCDSLLVPRQSLEQLEGLSVSDREQNTESLPDEKPDNVPQQNTKTARQAARPSPSQPASKGGTGKGLSGLALLLSVCALGLSGYLGWRGHTLEQALVELRTGMAQLDPQLARQQARLATLEKNSSANTDQYQQHLQRLQDQLQQSQQRETRLLSRVDALSAKVRTLEGSTLNQWHIAEVEYLLNLANQRLMTVHDVATSRELLVSADKILQQLDDYSLFPVRQALAEDLAVLQTVTQVNRQNIWLQLQAIANLVPTLTILDNQQRLADLVQPATDSSETTSNDAGAETGRSWQTVAEDVLMDTWERFTDLFRITTERTNPVEIILTDEQEQLIRQKMQLLIEQGQLALITGQQSIYQQSLQQASQWLTRYFAVGSGESQQLAEELAGLANLTIAPTMPGIQRSLEALKALNIAEPDQPDSQQIKPGADSEDQKATEPATSGESGL